MARTRSERYDDIQAGILAKAARLFATRGYERTTIADLVEACQLSRGSLYHYFEFEGGDFLRHARRAGARPSRSVAEGRRGDGPPRAVFERVVASFVAYNAHSPNEQIILLNDLGSLSEAEQRQIRGVEREIVALVAKVLAAVDQSGRMKAGNAKVYTMMFVSIINYTYAWYDPEGDVAPAEFAAMACDLFLNGFLRPQSLKELPKQRVGKRS